MLYNLVQFISSIEFNIQNIFKLWQSYQSIPPKIWPLIPKKIPVTSLSETLLSRTHKKEKKSGTPLLSFRRRYEQMFEV